MHRLSRYAHFMVRFTVLASGSKGNCSVVTGGNTRILVDAGLSCRELFRRMRLADEDPATLDAIIITHEHSDHVAGLAVTARKLGIPVYFTEAYPPRLGALALASQADDLRAVDGAVSSTGGRTHGRSRRRRRIDECDPEEAEMSADRPH